jgi:hypothetical protein
MIQSTHFYAIPMLVLISNKDSTIALSFSYYPYCELESSLLLQNKP